MTIQKIIDKVDKLKPNAVDAEIKLGWIAELDGRVAQDVMLMHPDELYLFAYSYPQDLEKTPLVEFPHDAIYEKWLLAKIDEVNQEWDEYANSMEVYNTCYKNYVRWFANTWRPAQGPLGCSHNLYPQYFLTAYGLALMRGFEGSLDEWLHSLIGPKGDKGDPFRYEDFTQEQLAALSNQFVAVYGQTAYNEVTQAYAAGLTLVAENGTNRFPMTYYGQSGCRFSGWSEGKLITYSLSSAGEWSEESTQPVTEDTCMVVHLTRVNPVSCVADKTYAEIDSAYSDGKLVFLVYNDIQFVLTRKSRAGGYDYIFKQVYETEYVVGGGGYYEITVNASDSWQVNNANIPHSTDTVTENGVRLPTAKAVYDFVTAKLEEMPNAAEVGY